MLDANRIAQKFLKKAADVPVPEAPAAHQVTSARLMDLLVFSVAYDSFIEAMSEKQQSPAKLATKGLSLFSRFAPELTAGMNQHLAHLLDNPTAGTLKPGFHRAIMSGAPNTRIHMVAHFVKTCLPWMKSHTSIIQDTFPSRSGIAARSLAAACMEQSTASRLNKVAGIAPVTTGLSTLKHWTALAAEEAGVPLRPIEGALADATMAKGLGEDLKKLNVEIATSDPNTPEAAELQTKRTQILDEIQKVSDESGDPQTVMATAVSAATTTQMHATEIGKRLGHTPDQEAAMMVRGRALIAAGAGSGKCIKGDTLVQTSNGFIPIKDLAIGLEPEQDRELEMTVNGINGPEKTSHIYFDGFRKTLKIETAHGYELEGTGPHKILVMQKGTPTWVALQDIKIGDKACIDARPGLFAKTPFIGKIESDFGIPYDILRACKPSVTEFLRDMLDDADVYEDSIEFFTEDNQLAVELHNLLLAYGIAAQRDGSPEVGWCFYIQESDLKTFAKEIGFKSKEKQDDLAAAVANLATTEPEGWFLDPVINISESEAEVYDFVVPGTHSFSAGGFINHNTRVLASQVAYHINELGVPASSIMATSFTRKASAELMKRVSKYGAVIEGPATDGFGTTHAICGNILNKRAREFKKVSYMGREEGWKQTTLLRLAMEQVKMSASGGQTPPEPKGLWDGAYVPDGGTQTQQGISPQVQDNDREFRSALREATGYFQWAARTWPGDRGRWAAKAVSMLQNVQGKSVLDLRPDQKQAVNEIFSKVKVKGEFPIKYRVASQNVEAYVSRDDDEPDPNDASPKQRHNKLEGYTYFKTPARQWFNLGHDLTKETEENAGKKGKTGVPVGEFKNAISILKGKGLSPSQAWADSPFGKHSDKAAVYAAYEWLKSPKGEPEFAGQGDMDDILIDTVKALVASPNLRHQIQAQYKCILVDEAQDLNRCVSGDTIVITPSGEKRIRDLVVGDKIQSYENGLVLYREVTAKAQSSWNRGYKICTQNGREITMSPDHQIYATAPLAIPKGKLALYLMYRKDLGFRIGVSSRPILRTAKGCGGRGSSERADCIWILEINDVEDILFKEQAYSLTYAVPTQVYEGTVRGLNQARIDRVFNEFGMNGQKLLAKYDLNFNLPHWINPTVSDAKTNRKVVNLYAHRCNGKKEQRASSACIT